MAELKDRCKVGIDLVGPEKLITQGAPRLVEFAVKNAIANACESSEVVSPADQRAVTVNWGATDRDAWVAVLDFGAGLEGGIEYFGFAKSSKEEHLGVGLTIARRAARSLGGDVSLEEREDGGVTCRLQWRILDTPAAD